MLSFQFKDIPHTCSTCQHTFFADHRTMLKTDYERSLWTSPSDIFYLEDYQKVECPQCGAIEVNDKILFLGICHPKYVFYLVWGMMLLGVVLMLLD